MDEDDLLTPYKEESFEVYEKRTLDDSSSESSEISSEEEFIEADVKIVEQIETGEAEKIEIAPEEEICEELPKRKRGRPRKPRPPTPDIAEVPVVESNTTADITFSEDAQNLSFATPTPKRSRGRPRRGEESTKKRLQILECIIPEGTKRKSRPSRFFADYESFSSKTLKDELGDDNEKIHENGIRKKRGPGRPRTRPIKVKVYLPDGTPRGRGRPRLKPLLNKFDQNGLLIDSDAMKPCINENGEIVPMSNGTTLGNDGTVSIPVNILNGGIRIKRKRGRPRKYPFIEKIRKGPKRVARPGKKLGRPKKNVQKEPSQQSNKNRENNESLENKGSLENKESSEPTWKIKWKGIFKYVTGTKSPMRRSNGLKAQKAKKRKRSGQCEANKENLVTQHENGEKQLAESIDESVAYEKSESKKFPKPQTEDIEDGPPNPKKIKLNSTLEDESSTNSELMNNEKVENDSNDIEKRHDSPKESQSSEIDAGNFPQHITENIENNILEIKKNSRKATKPVNSGTHNEKGHHHGNIDGPETLVVKINEKLPDVTGKPKNIRKLAKSISDASIHLYMESSNSEALTDIDGASEPDWSDIENALKYAATTPNKATPSKKPENKEENINDGNHTTTTQDSSMTVDHRVKVRKNISSLLCDSDPIIILDDDDEVV